jgi:hypothetical protein
VGQLFGGIAVGFWLTERWQRWRQRREFQDRTLVKYSDLSYDLADRLSELLVTRSSSRSDLANLVATFPSNQRELIACWTALVSTRGEMMAAFGRDFVLGPDYQGFFAAVDTLRSFLREREPVPQARFEPEQEKFLEYREAVVAHMVLAMGLLSKSDWESEVATSRARLADAVKEPSQG